MKIRNGFVSNSSSGSFIFPSGCTEEEVIRKVKSLVEFANKLECDDEKYACHDFFSTLHVVDDMFIEYHGSHLPEAEEIGKRGLREVYCGRCVLPTADDNSVPYWMHNVLCDKMGAIYIHYG